MEVVTGDSDGPYVNRRHLGDESNAAAAAAAALSGFV